MRVTATSNARQLARAYRAIPNSERLEQRREAPFIAAVLTKDARAQLGDDVYRVPIKRSRSGRPLWRRTGRLLAAEQWVAAGESVRHRNTASHYIHRLRYGRSGGRPARPPQKRWGGPAVVVARRARWVHRRRQAAHLRALRRHIGLGG